MEKRPAVFIEFPKYLYHPRHAPQGKLFANRAEELAIPPGEREQWVDSPAKFPGPTRAARFEQRAKRWVSDWESTLKLTVLVLGIIAALLTIAKALL